MRVVLGSLIQTEYRYMIKKGVALSDHPVWCEEHQLSIYRSDSISTDALLKEQDLIVKAFFAMFRNNRIVLILKNEDLSL